MNFIFNNVLQQWIDHDNKKGFALIVAKSYVNEVWRICNFLSPVEDNTKYCSSVLYCVHKAIYEPYKLHKYAALIRWLQCDAVKRIAGCNTVHAAVIVLL